MKWVGWVMMGLVIHVIHVLYMCDGVRVMSRCVGVIRWLLLNVVASN